MSIAAIFVLIVSAILPAFVWLVFFLKEDIHPEPKKLLFRAFGFGIIFTVPALIAQIFFKDAVGSDNLIVYFLGLALIEEVFKFFAAWSSVRGNPSFDEPIDAMIYMITVAAGFATVENILIIIDTIHANSASPYPALNVLLLRFVGATLLHILTSAIVGYYWAKVHALKTHHAPLVSGIIIASFIHFIFNYFVAGFGSINLVFSSILLLTAAFFVLNDFEILKKNPAA